METCHFLSYSPQRSHALSGERGDLSLRSLLPMWSYVQLVRWGQQFDYKLLNSEMYHDIIFWSLIDRWWENRLLRWEDRWRQLKKTKLRNSRKKKHWKYSHSKGVGRQIPNELPNLSPLVWNDSKLRQQSEILNHIERINSMFSRTPPLWFAKFKLQILRSNYIPDLLIADVILWNTTQKSLCCVS